MTASEVEALPEPAHEQLGLAPDSSEARIEGAYWRLRAHIEARALGSHDPAFVAARQAELDALHESVRRVTGDEHSPLARRAPVLGASGHGAARPSPPARWRRTAALLSGLLALAAFGTWLALQRPPATKSGVAPPEPGMIAVEAEPADATLQIFSSEDERVVASASADGSPLPVEEGSYTLRVAHPGCPDEWSHALTIESGERVAFAPRLCAGSGRLIVRSNVSGDRVRIDDLDVGTTGETPHALSVGLHDVSVSKQGYETWTGRIKLEPDQQLTLLAELTESRAGGRRDAAGQAPPPRLRAGAPESAATAAPEGSGERALLQLPPPTEGAALSQRVSGGEGKVLRTGKGGSKTWHDAVKHSLVSKFDRNQSGSLDTPDEIHNVPCELWLDIERSYETGGLAVNMTHLYGFDGSDAPANTLGVTYAMRSYTFDRMKQCGLKTQR